jgi:hypothetical protein
MATHDIDIARTITAMRIAPTTSLTPRLPFSFNMTHQTVEMAENLKGGK